MTDQSSRKGLLIANLEERVTEIERVSEEMQDIVQNYVLFSHELIKETIFCLANGDWKVISMVLMTISDMCILLLRGITNYDI